MPRPGASPASTAPSGVTCSRVTRPDATAPAQLAAVRGLLPLVAEQLAAADRVEARLGLARAVGAEHVEVLADAQVRLVDDDLRAGRHAADDVARERRRAIADRPAELLGERGRDLGRGSQQTPGP